MSSEENKLFCKNCGKEIKKDDKFCPDCGTENELYVESTIKSSTKKSKKKLFIFGGIVIIIIAIIVIISLIGSNKVNFKKIYQSVGGNTSTYREFITVGADNSYLKIDTNPNNQDDYSSYTAWLLLLDVNKKLGFPESLQTKMGETRSIDGRQSETFGNISVSWTYHPDKGLEVLYEKK